VENAIIKARHAAGHSGLPALADDSGIEVDALQGAPGIYSARFAGINATDADNNAKLLDALKDIPEHKRTARYQCVLVLFWVPELNCTSAQIPKAQKNAISHRGSAIAQLLGLLRNPAPK